MYEDNQQKDDNLVYGSDMFEITEMLSPFFLKKTNK